MTRRRSPSAQVERDLYLASRTVGDLRAARRGFGPILLRLLKRRVHRSEIRAAKKGGLW